MGRRVVYTCDCCKSVIDLDKKVGILANYNAKDYEDGSWELLHRRYLCDRCLEKIILFINK